MADSIHDERGEPGPGVEPVICKHFALVLQVTTGLGVAITIAGSVLGLIENGRLPHETVAIHTLRLALIDLDAGGIVSLGLLTILAAPAVGLLYLTQAFLRARDRLYGLVALLVLMILAISVLIAQLTRGG